MGIISYYWSLCKTTFFKPNLCNIAKVCSPVVTTADLARLSKVMVQSKVVPVHSMKACWGSRDNAPFILDCGTRWW